MYIIYTTSIAEFWSAFFLGNEAAIMVIKIRSTARWDGSQPWYDPHSFLKDVYKSNHLAKL